jgi:hypothetical protein
MPVGFRKSSGNNRRLVLAGKRFRGEPCDTDEPHHALGIPPSGTLTFDAQEPRWGGHNWSDWQPLNPATTLPPVNALGLYRIRDAAKSGVLYIGEGIIAARLTTHWRKTRKAGDRQGDFFRDAVQLECSWVLNSDWQAHHRLELETDLVGSHLLVHGIVPAAQFIG